VYSADQEIAFVTELEIRHCYHKALIPLTLSQQIPLDIGFIIMTDLLKALLRSSPVGTS
jgi:hypothetical protein